MLSTVSRPHAPKAIVLAEHWRRYRRDGEREVRDQLVLAYSPIVKHVAGRIASRMPPHVDLADLVAYGLAGLIEAVERYDPSRGVKFESFAGHPRGDHRRDALPGLGPARGPRRGA